MRISEGNCKKKLVEKLLWNRSCCRCTLGQRQAKKKNQSSFFPPLADEWINWVCGGVRCMLGTSRRVFPISPVYGAHVQHLSLSVYLEEENLLNRLAGVSSSCPDL